MYLIMCRLLSLLADERVTLRQPGPAPPWLGACVPRPEGLCLWWQAYPRGSRGKHWAHYHTVMIKETLAAPDLT